MQEVSDTPETKTEAGIETGLGTSIRKDTAAKGGGSTNFKEDCLLMSHAKRDLLHLDYQARSSESNYVTDLGSRACDKESLQLGREYYSQKPYSTSSSCSWDRFSLEEASSSPDAFGHVVGKMRDKTNTLNARPDLASYPTAAPDINDSEHHYQRSDRFTGFSSYNGRSVEYHDEMVDYAGGYETTPFSSLWCFDDGDPSLPRGLQYGDEIPSLSCKKYSEAPRRLQYGDEIPSLSRKKYNEAPRRLQYGDEIPSLSRKKYNEAPRRLQYGDEIPSLSHKKYNEAPRRLQYGDEIPSLSRKKYNEAPRRLQYGDEIPSLSRKKYNGPPPRSSLPHYGSETTSLSRIHYYGDEIPSLSRNWRYHDKIQSRTGHWCHDADAHPLSRYQQDVSHGNGHSRHHFARTNGDELLKLAAGKHTFTKPRMLDSIVNSSDHYRTNIKDKPCRSSEVLRDQVRGPRANKLNDTSGSSTEKAILSPLVRRDQFNKSDFSVQFEHAKFFMIKSYSEDDIHKGIKYNVWASTPNGNNKLDAAFHQAQVLMKEKGKRCPVFLFFSVNTSGQFLGLAEMLGPVDFKKTMDFWEEDRWNGFFPITWHIIKDIPNRLFKHIVLENNNNRIVTFSRDTQEIGLPQGLEMLKIFKDYCPGTSILDDFDFYEEKDRARRVQKRGNSEPTRQARFSDDYRSMENLEASMENWSLDGAWD